MINPDAIVRQLPVRLTEDEITQMGRENARDVDAHSSLELERKAKNDEYKSKMGSIEHQISHRSSCINTGYETRQVECVEEVKITEGKAYTTRTDTREVVEVRPLRADEYQTAIPGLRMS